MKISARIVLLALFALLIGAAGCGNKDEEAPAEAKKGAAPTPSDNSSGSANGKESGASNPGGFGK